MTTTGCGRQPAADHPTASGGSAEYADPSNQSAPMAINRSAPVSAATFDDQWGVTTDVLSWIAQAAAGRLELGEFRGLLSRRGFDSHDVSDLVELVTAARG